MSEKQFEDWLKNIYPSKSDSTIKDTLIFANNLQIPVILTT